MNSPRVGCRKEGEELEGGVDNQRRVLYMQIN